MAPFQGPGREELLKILRGLFGARKLPITLGQYEPQAVVECVDGEWRIVALRLNSEKARAAGDAELASGGMWMPEMEWQFLEKTETLVAAPSRKALAAKVEKLRWKWGP